MNSVSLIGALTKDPELRILPGTNTPVLDVRIAVRRPKAAKDGTDADFFGVTLFGRPAEIVNQYSAKGKRIGVTGRLQLDEWGDADNRNSRVLVIAENVIIIDWPPRPEGTARSDEAVDNDGVPIAF